MLIKYEQYKRAVRELQPDAVLYRDEMYVSGRVISAAMKGRVRLVGVQHGIIHTDESVYCFDEREVDSIAASPDHVKSCPLPDVFATFGEHTGELFRRRRGYAPRVEPIGGVRHDELARRFPAVGQSRERLRTNLRRSLGLPLDRKVVLLFTQRAVEAGAWFEMVVRALRGWEEEVVVGVKTHQYHGGERQVRETAERLEWGAYRLFDAATYPLMYCSDVVVGGASTIILEACLLGTPAVSIAGNGDYEVYPYVQDRIGAAAFDGDSMREHLRVLLSDDRGEGGGFASRRQEILRRHLWNDDARACERLYDLIGGSTL